MNITINPNLIEISTIIEGYRVKRQYIGYTQKEAIRKFKNFVYKSTIKK